jgi:hypothetical protein
MTVKEAPAKGGLRGFFARFRGRGGSAVATTPAKSKAAGESGHVKVVEPEAAAETAAPETATPETATPETATPETATPETATPETATPETTDAAPETATAEATPETATPETATPETATPETATPETATPETATPETATPETATPETTDAAALPLASYDTLTVASLRARLRTLTTAQLTVLIDYEKAHLGRDEVVTMFERRILKIKAGETTSFQAV